MDLLDTHKSAFLASELLKDVLTDALRARYRQLVIDYKTTEDDPSLRDGYNKTFQGIEWICCTIHSLTVKHITENKK